jgi:hypothetical protein
VGTFVIIPSSVKEELFILFIPQNQPLFEGVVPCCGENNFEKLLV